MRRILVFILIMSVLPLSVSAMEMTAPLPPEEAAQMIPESPESFGDGLMDLLKAAVPKLQPAIGEACKVSLGLIVVTLLTSLLQGMPGKTSQVIDLAATVAVGAILLGPSNSMIHLGAETVEKLSEYGKLLLPVMTAAMAAQGGIGGSAALYTGTVVFDALLSTAISKLIVPVLYFFLCLAVANSAVGEDVLKKVRDFLKWLMTWGLKTILYIFTGYMGITGVVCGTVDAAAVKAAKLTISGVVPVVGGILSDASEAVLVSAGIMKNAAGIYGLLAILAIWIGPFLEIGAQYLLLKLTAAVCDLFGSKKVTDLIGDFSTGMGLLLGMTGAVCLLLLISTVCFMKGVG